MQVFKECHINAGDGKSFELSLAGCKCIGAYVKNKKNQNQVELCLPHEPFSYFDINLTI